jgi:broad specificity phosphatase PhoE
VKRRRLGYPRGVDKPWTGTPRAHEDKTGSGEPQVTSGLRRDTAVVMVVGELTEHVGRTVLVVSHVTLIKLLLAAGMGVGDDAVHRVFLEAASLCTVTWSSDGRRACGWSTTPPICADATPRRGSARGRSRLRAGEPVLQLVGR